MTASCSIGAILHRNGAGHRRAKSGTASAIFVTHLNAPAAFRQSLVTSRLLLFSAISNRYTKLLEILVSYTKQKVDTHSNRCKRRVSSHRYLSSSSFHQSFAGPERSHRADGVRSTPLAVALVPNFAETKRACASLIANEMHSPQLVINSKRATYDFLIANEFRFANRSRLSHV